MKIEETNAAYTAISSLAADEKIKVRGLVQSLGNWENDEHLQKVSRRLSGHDDIYALSTTSDLQIIYCIGEDTIRVLDVVRTETLEEYDALRRRFSELPVPAAK